LPIASAPFILSDTRNALLNVACPWCKPLVVQLSLCRAHSAQMDYNWTALAEYHCLTLSLSMTRPEQCWQLSNESIPMLHLLFESPL
jgi:hypothetical protein